MGLGRYQSGEYHLVASLRHLADQARIDEWKACFVHASRLLFEATDGQHRISTVALCNDSTAGLVADLWLEEHDGRAFSGHGGIGRPGIFAQLWGDERRKPFIAVHELGHLLYHLHDEYTSASASGTACIGGSTANACIMEGGFADGDQLDATGALVPGRIRRFCVASNHDPDHDTRQHRNHAESCWETMASRGVDLVLPADLPVGADPGALDSPRFLQLVSVPRIAVVLDRSASMAGEKLEQAKVGAHFAVDLASDGNEFALVSFASAATVDVPRHPMGADRELQHFAVETLTAQGQTSIGDGLRTASDELNSAGVRSSVQSVLLLTDGLQTHGESPESVLPDLVRTLTRVYTVGLGPDIDEPLLRDVADRTAGEFARIDPDLPEDQQAFAMRSELERFAVLARDGGGVADGSPEVMTNGQRLTRSSVIEPGARTATFVLSWPNAKDKIRLEVVGPDGQVVAGPGVHVIEPRRPYVAVRVARPAAGLWRVRMTCRTERPEARLQRWTFVENPGFVGGLHLPAGVVASGAPGRATFSLAYGRTLTGVRIAARLIGPEGPRSIRFRAGSFDSEGEGEYAASFRAPGKPGVYRLALTVRNDPLRTRYASYEEVQEAVPTPPLPNFRRQFSTSLVVA